VRYGYFTVQNDNSNSDAVTAFFGTGSNGTITIERDAVIAGQSNATNAQNLDERLNIAIKDVTGSGVSITTSALCATNWNDGGNVSLSPGIGTATGVADRTALVDNTPTPFVTDPISILAGVTKKYCVQFTWVDGTSALDNPAKQGSNIYTITFNGASS
jgi:hypothetical protein